MPRSFNIAGAKEAAAKLAGGVTRDPRLAVRVGLGALLAANLVAAVLAFHPFGGSPEDLQRQVLELERQVSARQMALGRVRAVAAKVDKGRAEGDQFLNAYFLNSRTLSSAIYSELKDSAEKAGLKAREHTFSFEPIEGSGDLSMLTVSAGYEGTYVQLVKFVNLIDHSPRLLIIEMLQAQPMQQTKTLTISMRLNAFVRESGGGQ
jgi:type IV pilus assembly protein PilO